MVLGLDLRHVDGLSDPPPDAKALTVNVILTDRMVTKLRTAMVVGASVILVVQAVTLAFVIYIALH